MTVIEELLAASRAATPPGVRRARPTRRLAVVTCMDARVDPRTVFGLALGEAHVLRNAGGRVTDDVLRSLALSGSILGVDTVVLMQHTQCGLEGASDVDLRGRTGADIEFLPIDDHAASLRHDVDLLVRTPYLSWLQAIAGLLYDVETGAVEDVVRWTRET
ncbi:MAG TPA: carbonic anhydrase [Acidimicrobiales bacterium]